MYAGVSWECSCVYLWACVPGVVGMLVCVCVCVVCVCVKWREGVSQCNLGPWDLSIIVFKLLSLYF